MRNFKDIIIEKLKVTSSNVSEIDFDMFADDCSGLYQRIEVLKYDAPEEPELVKVF